METRPTTKKNIYPACHWTFQTHQSTLASKWVRSLSSLCSGSIVKLTTSWNTNALVQKSGEAQRSKATFKKFFLFLMVISETQMDNLTVASCLYERGSMSRAGTWPISIDQYFNLPSGKCSALRLCFLRSVLKGSVACLTCVSRVSAWCAFGYRLREKKSHFLN